MDSNIVDLLSDTDVDDSPCVSRRYQRQNSKRYLEDDVHSKRLDSKRTKLSSSSLDIPSGSNVVNIDDDNSDEMFGRHEASSWAEDRPFAHAVKEKKSPPSHGMGSSEKSDGTDRNLATIYRKRQMASRKHDTTRRSKSTGAHTHKHELQNVTRHRDARLGARRSSSHAYITIDGANSPLLNKLQRKNTEDTEEEMGAWKPRQKNRKRRQPEFDHNYADGQKFKSLNETVLRRSEISHQDDEYQRACLQDFAKKRAQRIAKNKKEAENTLKVQAHSFMQYHIQECRRRVLLWTDGDPATQSATISRDTFVSTTANDVPCKKSVVVILKIKFLTGASQQIAVRSTAPIQVLFDFCDFVLFMRSPPDVNVVPILAETDEKIAADVGAILSDAKRDDVDNPSFSLPERFNYCLQMVNRSSLHRPANLNEKSKVHATIESVGLRGRAMLFMRPEQGRQSQSSAIENIGSKSSKWDESFRLLTHYQSKHGHCNVPPHDATLGMWVATQQAAYAAKKDRLAGREPRSRVMISQDQIDRLEKLGFQWES